MDTKKVTEISKRKKLVKKKGKFVSKIPRTEIDPGTSKKKSRIPVRKSKDKQLICDISRKENRISIKENVSGKSAQKRKNTSLENEEESVEAIQKYLAKESSLEHEKDEIISKPSSPRSEVKKADTGKTSTQVGSFVLPEKTVADEVQTNLDNLSPDFINLILKPKSSKVRRPPNAFMLFAKEQRHLIQAKHSEANNRQISSILGETWRNLDSNEKIKYYCQAMALEKLHKQIHPDYVYNPAAARLSKEKRKAKKLSIDSPSVANKENELSSFNYFFNKDDPKLKQDETSRLIKNISGKENEKTPNLRPFSPLRTNQLVSPNWNSQMCKEWSSLGNRTPLRESYCNLYCSPPMYNSEGNYPTFKRYPHFDAKENELAHSFGSPSTSFKTPNIFPSNFFPTTWNPWVMCSHPPTPRPHPPEFFKNWMPSTSSTNPCPSQPGPSLQNKSLHIDDPVLAVQSPEEENMIKDKSYDLDDDESNSLIIVDDINSDDDLYTSGCRDTKLRDK